ANVSIDENYAQMHLEAQAGSYVVITVLDTGTGIAPEIISRIFEPFFTTKKLGKGTGLGLTTVTAVVKSHSGFINVYSELGKGSQFKVYLPTVKAIETRPAALLEQSTDPGEQILKGQGEQILVVDDEIAIRDITKTSLEAANYKVLTASNGIEAVALYAQHLDEISLVLMDMNMPTMDGPTTIRTLQKINPTVKIVAVSGFASSDKVAEAASLGVKTFLAKPYTIEELVKILHRLLSPA
ncbi:MAG TPA: response regulator, partial [Candidatus Caenarcaniphilales bacterium]